MTLPLFSPEDLPEQPSPAQAARSMPAGKPRLRRPIRDQIEMRWASLDELLEADHPARVVWAAVCKLDLKSWLGEIKAVEGHVGRDATDPRLLVALWTFATLKGIGSAINSPGCAKGKKGPCRTSGCAAVSASTITCCPTSAPKGARNGTSCSRRSRAPCSMPG